MFRPNPFRAATAAAFTCFAAAASGATSVISDAKPATMVRTDEIVVHSDEIGRDFLVEITMPDLPPGTKAPVIYALDGGYGLVGQAARLLAAGNRIPPAYVVSIGYPNPRGRNFGPRETDLIHRKIAVGNRSLGGGGAAFEAFLIKDLRPMLEARYPIDSARSVLVGHSSGALFAATMLLTQPDAFSAYVIGSIPVAGYDPTMPDQVRSIAAHGDGKRVFIGMSPDDFSRGSDTFAAALTGKGSTFTVRSELFEGESHTSSYLQLVTHGLPFVLPTPLALRTSVTLKPKVLDRYAGAYQTKQGEVVVSRRGNQLLVQLGSGGGAVMQAQTPTRFFSPTLGAELEFSIDAKGKATGFVFRDNGVDVQATRVP